MTADNPRLKCCNGTDPDCANAGDCAESAWQTVDSLRVEVVGLREQLATAEADTDRLATHAHCAYPCVLRYRQCDCGVEAALAAHAALVAARPVPATPEPQPARPAATFPADQICGFIDTIDGDRLTCVSPPMHAMEHRTADGIAFIPGTLTSRRAAPRSPEGNQP